MKVNETWIEEGVAAAIRIAFGHDRYRVDKSIQNSYRPLVRAVLEAVLPAILRTCVREIDKKHDEFIKRADTDAHSFIEGDASYVHAKEAIRALMRQDDAVDDPAERS